MAGAQEGPGLSAVLTVDPSQMPAVAEPPEWAFAAPLRPVLVLPGGLRVTVDLGATHTDAANWWRHLGVIAVYVAMWYDARAGDNN